MTNAVLSFFERVGTDIVKAASKVKSLLITAAKDEPEITAFIEKYGTEAEVLLNPLSPAAAAILASALKVWGSVANIIDKGGAAAESNLLNQGLDQAAIDAVKASIPVVKSVAGPKPATPAS